MSRTSRVMPRGLNGLPTRSHLSSSWISSLEMRLLPTMRTSAMRLPRASSASEGGSLIVLSGLGAAAFGFGFGFGGAGAALLAVDPAGGGGAALGGTVRSGGPEGCAQAVDVTQIVSPMSRAANAQRALASFGVWNRRWGMVISTTGGSVWVHP